MSTSEECKVGASTKSNDDGLSEVAGKLHNMSTDDADVSVCANCGKEGANNICNKCQVTKYCNAVCKKVHKKKHKKDCEEHIRLANEKHNEELKRAAELHDIELFKQPPPTDEDCPICFLRMPTDYDGSRYMECCGKAICSGCIFAPVYDDQGNEVDNNKCPFCRTSAPTSGEEIIEMMKNRTEAGDSRATNNQGCNYRDGRYGLPVDYTKALELFRRAAKLGDTEAYLNIGCAHHAGQGIEVDTKQAHHYYELSAMMGNERARHNLGVHEYELGNMDRAVRHYLIAVRDGFALSLEEIKELYTNGYATKEDYTKALQLYQEYLSEIKSPQRDKAAAAREDFRYY